MHDISEYNTKPRVMLVHSPENNLALQNIREADLETHNFTSIPAWDELNQEFELLRSAIAQNDIEVVDISDLLDSNEAELLGQNPNSIFTRDPLITLPWIPDMAIVSNMSLRGRKNEALLMKRAAHKIGVKHFFDMPPNAKIEGGDTVFATEGEERTLILGIGKRTNIEAAFWLAKNFIPRYLDKIICVKHNKKMLHLDTCFCLLPGKNILCADAAISSGMIIDSSRRVSEIKLMEYFEEKDYKIFSVSNDDAAVDEDCNMLFVEGNEFLSFEISKNLRTSLEQSAGINIHTLEGKEITKANGGAHCLTRPIY
jgi:N-dimethylarginine dimethylaminohydrolase